jgi:putative ABC transport system permease protein
MSPAKRSIAWSWVLKMAWRDSRASRNRLFLFSFSIVLGVAALAAIGFLQRSLDKTIDEQARELLGADLMLSSRAAFTVAETNLFEKLGGEQATEYDFNSMVLAPSSGTTRFVQVRALSGDFPFFGNFEAEPSDALASLRRGDGVLMEEALVIQLGVNLGDVIKLGNFNTKLVGILKKIPGETAAFAGLTPKVYLPFTKLAETGLMGKGSRVRYKQYFKFREGTVVEKLTETHKAQIERSRMEVDTVIKRKAALGKAVDNLKHFLNLIAFIALLLGSVGVASAIHVHINSKWRSIAVLRCMGARTADLYAIFLIQTVVMGLVGAMVGSILALGLHFMIPSVLGSLLPFKLHMVFSVTPILTSLLIGAGVSVLFSLLPLSRIPEASPLEAIRDMGSEKKKGINKLRLAIIILIGVVIVGFGLLNSQKWQQGLGFGLGLILVIVVFGALAKLILWLTRKIMTPAWPYVLRQGISNLYRPNNRTLLVLLSVGLASFLVLTLLNVENLILKELAQSDMAHEPNAILFDIQVDQVEGLKKLMSANGFPIMDEAPIVTMRLGSLKGAAVEDLLKDKKETIPNWALTREYRCTFQSALRGSEKLLEGKWVSSVQPDQPEIPISLEEGIAKELHLSLGDLVVMDVQGIPINTRVASIRRVDWRKVQPNFFIVFPTGALDQAPRFDVLATHVRTAEDSANLQRKVVGSFPNISIIDLTTIVATITSITSKIGFAVKLMAGFTVLTGVFVLFASIITGRYQRAQESTLLRTLGARRNQIAQIFLVEYAMLGCFSAIIGGALSLGASLLLARFVFQVPFYFPWVTVAAGVGAVTILTVILGVLTSGSYRNASPLAMFRESAN